MTERNKMDRRIGYGLSLNSALEKAVSESLQMGVPTHFSITTKNHSVIWGELRDDGWRVYVPSVTQQVDRPTSTLPSEKGSLLDYADIILKNRRKVT